MRSDVEDAETKLPNIALFCQGRQITVLVYSDECIATQTTAGIRQKALTFGCISNPPPPPSCTAGDGVILLNPVSCTLLRTSFIELRRNFPLPNSEFVGSEHSLSLLSGCSSPGHRQQ